MDIEFLRLYGRMPDRVYYQVNGKPPEWNYYEQHKRMMDIYNKETESLVYNGIKACLDEALDNILKDWK